MNTLHFSAPFQTDGRLTRRVSSIVTTGTLSTMMTLHSTYCRNLVSHLSRHYGLERSAVATGATRASQTDSAKAKPQSFTS